MLLQRAISLAALGLLAFTSNTQTVNAEPLAVVHGTKGETIKISANYLAAFDSDDAPETPFELVEADDVSSKLISLKKRGTGCAEYYTGKIIGLLLTLIVLVQFQLESNPFLLLYYCYNL